MTGKAIVRKVSNDESQSRHYEGTAQHMPRCLLRRTPDQQLLYYSTTGTQRAFRTERGRGAGGRASEQEERAVKGMEQGRTWKFEKTQKRTPRMRSSTHIHSAFKIESQRLGRGPVASEQQNISHVPLRSNICLCGLLSKASARGDKFESIIDTKRS